MTSESSSPARPQPLELRRHSESAGRASTRRPAPPPAPSGRTASELSGRSGPARLAAQMLLHAAQDKVCAGHGACQCTPLRTIQRSTEPGPPRPQGVALSMARTRRTRGAGACPGGTRPGGPAGVPAGAGPGAATWTTIGSLSLHARHAPPLPPSAVAGCRLAAPLVHSAVARSRAVLKLLQKPPDSMCIEVTFCSGVRLGCLTARQRP